MGNKIKNYGWANRNTYQEEWINDDHKWVIGSEDNNFHFILDGTTVMTIGPTGITEGAGDSLPDQAGSSGLFLTTDGTDASWADIDTYVDIDSVLPSQTGNSGYYLTTNGSTSSWAVVSGGGTGDVTKVGTPVDNQVGVWTGDGTLEGTSSLTYDGITLSISGIIQTDTSYSILGAEPIGSFYWNTDEETISAKLSSEVTADLAHELFIPVINQTGITIANGTPVMFGGSVGASGKALAILAIADSTYLSAYIMGIVTEEITNGDSGKVTWFGKVRGIDTSGTPYGEVWSDGDLVYISPTTAGYLTNVQPSAPNQIISVGVIVTAHASTGTLFVRPTWHCSLNELTDVNGTALTTSGQILVWDNDNSYFDFTENINDYGKANSATISLTDAVEYPYDTTSSTAEPLIVQVYDSTGVQLMVPAQVKVQVELDTTYKINLTSYIGNLTNVKLTWIC